MKGKFFWLAAVTALAIAGCTTAKVNGIKTATVQIKSRELSAKANGHGALKLDGIYYETERGRVYLPPMLTALSGEATADKGYLAQTTMPEVGTVKISITPEGNNFILKLSAGPVPPSSSGDSRSTRGRTSISPA
ncbi:MAG: hypothetical protein QM813_19955 [Verrucomicrobiota bacterium]